MNKKELLVIKPSDSDEEIFKKLILYLARQGIKISKKKSQTIN